MFNVFRRGARVGLYSHLMFTTTFEWSATPVWRRKSLMQGKCCYVVGMSGTNTSFQPADGNRTTPPKLTINTQSKIKLQRSNKTIIASILQLFHLFDHNLVYSYNTEFKTMILVLLTFTVDNYKN